MKINVLILSLLVTIISCGNSRNINSKIQALNGTWAGMCIAVDVGENLTGEYIQVIYEFSNGNYISNYSLYSDENCINAISRDKNEMGMVAYVEDVITETGVTANKVRFEVISSYLNRPPTYETLLLIDNNNLYFGSFHDDFNVLFFSSPYMKVDND